MACFHPLQGYRSKYKTVNGKNAIVFSSSQGYIDKPVSVPCGQCVGCRLERSRQWAIRCSHEADLYENNCFITLTYSDQNLPDDGSLHVEDFQKFMKRLRKFAGEGVRFYHCGEYGERFGRPHYHACIFNFDFNDKYFWRNSPSGFKLFRSDTLEKLWPFGHCEIGTVTFESAAYVARYIMKKVNGDMADEHYFDPFTGVYRKPEYTTMSRRPGIGKGWYDKFSSDVFPSDFVVVKGVKMRPPLFYDRQFEIEYPSDFEKIKLGRKLNAKKYVDNNTPDRLSVREQVQLAKLKRLPRNAVD